VASAGIFHESIVSHNAMKSAAEFFRFGSVFQPLHWGWSLQVLFLLLAGLVKIFPDFRCNLAICHLFNCFHSLDEMSETVIF
jgi:hypothetical protein